MGKGFRPRHSRLKEDRLQEIRKKGNERTSKIEIDLVSEDPTYLDKFSGKIWFWSFTVKKVRPTDHVTLLRVTTHRYVPRHNLFNRVEHEFPDGCRIKPVIAYDYRHTFDIRVSQPLRVETIIKRVTKALDGVL